MQRAHAEIGRAGAARLLAREREGGEVADPLVAIVRAGAAQRVELGGDAEAFANRSAEAVGRGRRDRQRAFDALDNETAAADRQLGQGDPALGDGASVRQVAPDAVRGLDAPFGDGAVLAHDPRVDRARHVAQRRGQRLAEAQHEREGQPAALSVVDQPRETVARLGFARCVEPERGEKRDLGFRRNDRAFAADVPPIRRDSRRVRELVDRLDGGRSGMKPAARGRRFCDNERGARPKLDTVGERKPALGRGRIVRSR